MGLIESIGHGPVALDSSIFIYFIEQHPRYAPVLLPLFERISGGKLSAVTSALTLLETLVVPYRAGDLDLAGRYETILTQGRGLTLVPLDLQIVKSAAGNPGRRRRSHARCFASRDRHSVAVHRISHERRPAFVSARSRRASARRIRFGLSVGHPAASAGCPR